MSATTGVDTLNRTVHTANEWIGAGEIADVVHASPRDPKEFWPHAPNQA